MQNSENNYDLIIIGAGPAGLFAAEKAAKAKELIAERRAKEERKGSREEKRKERSRPAQQKTIIDTPEN